MEAMRIEGTDNTPAIVLDHEQEKFEFSGESRPENVRKFYEPILEWIDGMEQYFFFVMNKFEGQERQINFDFKFEYFNSSSAKYILDIMHALKSLQDKIAGLKINVRWHYEEFDEDMQEAGEEFEQMAGLGFEYIVVS